MDEAAAAAATAAETEFLCPFIEGTLFLCPVFSSRSHIFTILSWDPVAMRHGIVGCHSTARVYKVKIPTTGGEGGQQSKFQL